MEIHNPRHRDMDPNHPLNLKKLKLKADEYNADFESPCSKFGGFVNKPKSWWPTKKLLVNVNLSTPEHTEQRQGSQKTGNYILPSTNLDSRRVQRSFEVPSR